MIGPEHVRFHGVRGSAPASGASFAEFGGDTPAIECRFGDRRIFIDAGSGLRNVTIDRDFPTEFEMVLSHYHFDHLIGMPFFEPLWRIDGRMRIYAPKFDDREPSAILGAFYSSPFCPVRLSDFKTRIEVIPYPPGGRIRTPSGIDIATISVDHPGGCAVIRLSSGYHSLVYASDVELPDDDNVARLSAFARDTDLLILDAMNDDRDTPHRKGWGHSSWRRAIETGRRANATAIALFHHDPRKSDAELSKIDAEIRVMVPHAFLARQGAAHNFNEDAARGETASWRCSR